ncbi:hypothetical protein [Pacificoceanicola onchidii]|uniref:hypothetical protein n=1 Tax=Pacificoceanicola onchidii TaxID=2562685 RepID=UPI001981DA94|nr:hypothetical protein [Pacificoceanicola onchidii]
MSDLNGSCTMKCWSVAGALGALSFLLNMAVAGRGFFASLILGLLVFGLLGLLFNWLFCKSGSESEASEAASGAGTATAAATGAAVAGAAGAASAAPTTSAARAAEAAEEAASDTASSSEADAASAAESADAAADTSDEDDAAVKPSQPLAGEEDLAARKGEWKYEGDAEVGEAAGSDDADSEAAEASAPAAAEAPAQSAASEAETGVAASGGDGVGVIKPSKPLAGQDDLAARKGTWRYDGGDPAPSGASEDKVDRDGDGVIEGTDEGSKPAMLDGPRDGGADNLKEIKGVGPKLEQLCNSLGIYHFDQIAAWSKDELAWIDSNLAGFKGRATRDDWVGQAKILASGGETEFSQRVEDGKVY